MDRIREFSLNGLLALMVAVSVGLSVQVWFPPDRVDTTWANDPRVQAAPPTFTRTMPDIFRPERILVRTASGQAALLPAETDGYRRVWAGLQPLVVTGRVPAGPTLVEDVEGIRDAVILALPIALTLGEWADHWGWNTVGLRSPSIKIDRVLITRGPSAGIYLAGPTGGYFAVGTLSAAEQELLQGVVEGIDPALFAPYRPLMTQNLNTRVMPGLHVPTAREMPQVERLRVLKPDEKAEEARYFPDLSVIRQIDERDARGFTDGQRFLRLTATGVLEFRMAASAGTAPDLSRAMATAQEWVNNRGGWGSDLVMSHYVQQPGRTRITFDVRGRGPYPVESSQGALQIEVTADRLDIHAQRVTYLKRLPDFWATFAETMTPIISPEEAIQVAIDRYPRHLIFDEVRDMHLAYHVKLDHGGMLEPVWVLQVGESRLYVPAELNVDQP